MKTTLEKVLLGICVCLTAGCVILAGFCLHLNSAYVVPNSRKFDKAPLDWIEGITNIGDGNFFYHHFVKPYNLRIRDLTQSQGLYGDIILYGELAHKFENEIFYGYFQDGYAIVYPESNLCKVLRVSRSDYPEGRSVDYEENPDGSYTVKKVEIESGLQKHLIVYIDSFEEFTPYEQKMLKELVE